MTGLVILIVFCLLMAVLFAAANWRAGKVFPQPSCPSSQVVWEAKGTRSCRVVPPQNMVFKDWTEEWKPKQFDPEKGSSHLD